MSGINLGTAFLQIVPSIQGVDKAGEDAAGVFSGGFGKVMKAGAIVASVAALGAAAGAAFSATFGEAMERESATTKASAQLGLSEADSKALGASAGKLYSQAYGESFGDVTNALATVKSSLQGLGGDELEAATKKAMSFASAFEVDTTRSVQTVSTLIGSGLAKDSTEAFDLITAASQKVPAALREDVLDASDEYSQFFNALGFNGSQAFGALTAASDKGVFGIDKTGDAIKEFTIRATDMSTASTAAYEAIGLNAGEMANAILAGGETAQGATQKIIDGLMGITDPATQANTAIALFGTPLEDLGVQNVPTFLASLQGATGGLGDFAGAADAVDAKLGSTMQARFTGLTRTLGGIGPSLATSFLPVVGPVLDGLTGMATKALEFTDKIGGGISAFVAGFSGGAMAENLTDSQIQFQIWGDAVYNSVIGPWNTVASYFKDAIAAVKTVITGDFKPEEWFAAPDEDSSLVGFLFGIRDAASEVGAVFGDALSEIWDVLGEVAGIIGPALVDVFNELWPAVQELFPIFSDLLPLLNPFSLIFKALLPVLPQIATVVGDLARTIGSFLASALTAVAPLFQKLADILVNKLMPMVADLVAKLLPPLMGLFEKLSPLLDAVLDALLPVADALIDALIPAIDALMPIVERVFDFIASTIGNAIDYFGGIIDFITGIFTGDWDLAWSGIRDAFGAIWQQIQDFLGFAWDAIVEIFTNIGPKLGEIVNALFTKVGEWGAQFLNFLWEGMQQAWPYISDWFAALPGRMWDAILALGQWVVERGGEFLSWLGQGIEAAWPSVQAWFAALPGKIWDAIVALAGWVVERGSEFLAWIGQGIEAGVGAILDWFTDLPGRIWETAQAAFSNVAHWGASLIQSMIDGIRESKGYLALAIMETVMDSVGKLGIPVDTLLDVSGLNVSGTIDELIGTYRARAEAAGGYGGGGYGGRGAVDPMRRAGGGPVFGPGGPKDDLIPALLSNGEFVNDAESTRKNRPYLEYANNGGDLRDLLPGFAAGGLVGGLGKMVGAGLIKAMIPVLADQVTDGLSAAGAGFAGNGNWGPENYAGLASNTAAARDFIQKQWGINNIGGWSPSGSVSTSDHPKGKALDVMIANYLSAAGIAQGTSVADWFINNPNSFGTKYVIWRDRINQGGAWSPYSHPSGNNDTLQHRDHVHISFLSGAGEFAGQPVGDTPKNLFEGLGAAVRSKFAGLLGGGASGSYNAGGGAEQWRGLMADVLAKVGAYKGLDLSSYVDRGLMQINSESSGNPNAINNYDINAQRGDPSIGLLQVIGSTFRNALKGTPFESLMAAGQRDPRASLTASTLYSLGRYGSLDKAWRGVAYGLGGIVPDLGLDFGLPGPYGKDNSPAFLTPGEAVLTAPQWDTAEGALAIVQAQANREGVSGSGPLVHVERIETVRGTPHDVVDELSWKMRMVNR